MRNRDLRRLRKAAHQFDYIALEPDDREDDAADHDGYSNVREREPIPLRDGGVIDPAAPWQFPTT